MSLKLIHFPHARSLRVVWALKELGLDADIETRVFDRPSLKQPEYLALHPLGKTPVFSMATSALSSPSRSLSILPINTAMGD